MDLPSHLADFADGLPLSLLRLHETWPHLPFSDKVTLLNHLLHGERPRGALRLAEQKIRLRSLAMDDSNPYIRHLGAKGFSVGWLSPNAQPTSRHALETAFQARIDADANPIVRHGNDIGGLGISRLSNAEEFWQRAHPVRLGDVTGAESVGEEMAKILLHATTTLIPQGQVSEREVLEVLLQYLGEGQRLKGEFDQAQNYARENWDGYADYSSRGDIKALWEALPQLTPEIRWPLLEALPVREDIFKEADVRAVLAQLGKHEITHLLYRHDVEFATLRREYFESGDDALQSAAICAPSFELLDGDLVRFQYRSEDSREVGKQKVRKLGHLIQSCPSMTLAQLEAVKDMFDALPDTLTRLFGPMESAEARQAIKQKQSQLSEAQLRREMRDLRIYALAQQCAPFDGESTLECLEGPLAALKDQVAAGDTWATYLCFKQALSQGDAGQYEKYLPAINLHHDVDESEYTEATRDEEDTPLTQLELRLRAYVDQWGVALKAQGEQLKKLSYVLLAGIAVAVLLQL